MATRDDVDDAEDDFADEEGIKPAVAAADSPQASENVRGEHDRFLNAKAELERRHHDKVSKVSNSRWVMQHAGLTVV